MEIFTFLMWISAILCIFQVKGHVIRDVDLIDSETDWKTANAKCILYGSTETEHFENITLNTTIPSPTIVWIAARPIYTHWVKLLGCFNLNRTEAKTVTSDGTLNSCLKVCSSNYVGITDEKCYCLKARPSTLNDLCAPCRVNTRDPLTPIGDSKQSVLVYTRTEQDTDDKISAFTLERNNTFYSFLGNRMVKMYPYTCRLEWVYGFSQYRFFDERLPFYEAKGRCKEPNPDKINGLDFPIDRKAWITMDWNLVDLKWGVDNAMLGRKQCIAATIDNNQLKPLFQNCNKKLKFLCEPGGQKLSTDPNEVSVSEVSNIWYIVIAGLGIGIIIVIVVLIIYVRKKNQARLNSKISVKKKLLVTQGSESTTQANNQDMDYCEIDEGNNKNKHEQMEEVQQEKDVYNDIDTNQEYAQINKQKKQTNNLENDDDGEYNELTFTNARTPRKINVDDTYDHMPPTYDEDSYDHCGQVKAEKHTEDYYDSVEKKDGLIDDSI